MSVKWSIIKALTCFLLVCSSTGYAQEASTITIEPRRVFRDTVIITKHDTVWLEKEKVKIEWGLLCIAHNITKLALEG